MIRFVTDGQGIRMKLTPGTRPGFKINTGTEKHDKLKNLGFEESGHTGFQKELTFDEVPTKDSKNPVTSGGVYNAIKDIPSGGGSSDVDLSEYVKKGTEGDNYIVDVSTASWNDEQGIVYEIQTKDKNGQPSTVELFASDDVVRENSDRLPTSDAVYTALAEKPSMSEVEAYIEETLLGGAW